MSRLGSSGSPGASESSAGGSGQAWAIDTGVKPDDVRLDVRIPASGGVSLRLQLVPWVGAVAGRCVSQSRCCISIGDTGRVVQLLNREVTDADLLGLRDFLKATMVEDLPELSVAQFWSATTRMRFTVIDSNQNDVCLGFEISQSLDGDGVEAAQFWTTRLALWLPVDSLGRYLGLDSHRPSSPEGLGDA